MDDKTKSIIFLFTIPIVAGLSVYIPFLLHAENLPDPLNVIVVLSVGFIPTTLMLWHWLKTYYFKYRVTGTN